jgi:hypothetical protein
MSSVLADFTIEQLDEQASSLSKKLTGITLWRIGASSRSQSDVPDVYAAESVRAAPNGKARWNKPREN